VAALIDPLADLKAEIAAEAGRPPKPGEDTPADEPEEEESPPEEPSEPAEDPDVAAQAAVEARKPKGKTTSARLVPAERLNEYALKNRQQAKAIEELNARLDRMEHPEKYVGPQPETEENVRVRIRAEEREGLRRESFLTVGYEAFGKKEFDDACNHVASLLPNGAGPGFVSMVIDTFEGNMKQASGAIKRLAEMDVSEAEAFLAKTPAAQVRTLSELVRTRQRTEPANGKRTRVQLEEDEEAPEPLRPLRGQGRIEEGLGDDVPDDVWFQRFKDRVLDKPRPH
jgi:hypothetical protein